MASVSDPINGEWPYQPLTLGRYVRKQPSLEGEEGRDWASRGRPPHYEAWREKIAQSDGVQLETQPEALVLDEVRRELGRASWVQPVLGEPGAGKSRLLREWALRLAANPAVETPFAFIRAAPWDVADLCAAYSWPTGLVGGGVIGIIELGGGWVQSDIDAYFAKAKLPKPSIVDVPIGAGGNNPNPGGDPSTNPDGEVALDIEVAAAAYSVATGAAASIRVYWADAHLKRLRGKVFFIVRSPTSLATISRRPATIAGIVVPDGFLAVAVRLHADRRTEAGAGVGPDPGAIEPVVARSSAVAPLYAGLFAAFGRKLSLGTPQPLITPQLWLNHMCFTDSEIDDFPPFPSHPGYRSAEVVRIIEPVRTSMTRIFNS